MRPKRPQTRASGPSPVQLNFKGGAPDPPVPGVIFRHQPEKGEVILNLDRLMKHERFWPSLAFWEAQGVDFSRGIRKWTFTQHEVILSVVSVPHDEFYALGSNAADEIFKRNFGNIQIICNTQPTSEEIGRNFTDAEQPLRKWILDESTLRAHKRWVEQTLARLSA